MATRFFYKGPQWRFAAHWFICHDEGRRLASASIVFRNVPAG
jgi:hypothetical protein